MDYFRCIIGGLLLGITVHQCLDLATGLESLRIERVLGILMTTGMAIVGFAPALVDAIKGEAAIRRRGILMLVAVGVIAGAFGAGNYLLHR